MTAVKTVVVDTGEAVGSAAVSGVTAVGKNQLSSSEPINVHFVLDIYTWVMSSYTQVRHSTVPVTRNIQNL